MSLGDKSADPASGPVRVRWLLPCAALALLAYPAGHLLAFPADVDVARALRALVITVFVAACWLSSALPLGAASLLPLALFPLAAVQPMAAVAKSYSDPILWMYFGGFVLARAIERVGLHRRIALHVIAAVGLRPRRLVLGFLLAALLLSMWISNTATALMLMPIGLALVDQVQAGGMVEAKHSRSFGVAVMLAIAYGCSIGGIGTPIGTPTNLVFFAADNYGALQKLGAPELGFGQWLLAFAPLSLVLGLGTWFLLTCWPCRLPATGDQTAAHAVHAELAALGRMRPGERRVLALFSLTVLAWVWRGDLGAIPGWVSLLGLPKDYVLDGVIAVLAGVAAFVIPSGERDGRMLMDWPTAAAIPWDMYFLLAGGFAIAQTLDATGLSRAFALSLAPAVQALPPVLSLSLVVLAVTLLSEVATNVAIASLMMPVLVATARSADLDPRALLLPATIAASFGFALPIATPPNAIVFATGKIELRDMLRVGLLVDLLCCALLVGTCFSWAFPMLGIDFSAVPTWWRK